MDYIEKAGIYIQKADQYLKKIFFAMAPIYKPENGEYQDVTVPLFTTLHSTSESILVLLLYGGLYDADVLLRGVMEGTIKYCYLMNGNTDKKKEKYFEYREKLYEIAKIADHKKAVEAIKILKEFSDNSTKPFEVDILPEDVLVKLQAKYPVKVQNEIKRKWSYQSMLRELAKTSVEYKAQLGTLATYSMTSHFCHFDWNGVRSREEQIIKSQEEDVHIWDLAHCLRILSNVMSMEMFRVTEYLRNSNVSLAEVVDISMEILGYINEIDEMVNQIVEDKINT